MSGNEPQRPVCLVTGSARRLGAAIAAQLAPHFDLAIHYRSSKDEAEQVAKRLRSENGAAQSFQADLADPAQAAGLIPEIVRRMGRIDMVVCSASLFDYDTPSEFSAEAMQRSLGVNLMAPMILARELAQAGSPEATLVHMLDSKVFSLNPDFFSYSLSKAAFHMIAPFLALEYGDQGIRAFNLQPGAILTERIIQDMGGFGFGPGYQPPEVIAEVVLWLATNPEADAMNGQCIQGQQLCHERGLLPGWSLPGAETVTA